MKLDHGNKFCDFENTFMHRNKRQMYAQVQMAECSRVVYAVEEWNSIILEGTPGAIEFRLFFEKEEPKYQFW